jgi:Carboxypeptidase regulatory-like domain
MNGEFGSARRTLRALGASGWLVVMILAVMASPARAQSLGAGAIEGTVTDESHAAMPGVTVTAASPALQVGQVVVVSQADGTYRLPSLPAGVYEVVYDLPGFQKVVRQDLRLNGGFVATINIVMKVSGVEETLTVVGVSPVVDIKTTSAQTAFTKETLEATPVSRTMFNVLAMTPGVRMAGIDIGGSTIGNQQGYATYGVSNQGTPMLEGLNTSQNDQGGTQVFFDYNSFDEVQVKALGNGAEVASPGSTMMGIVKSGGNDFHGRYFGAYENKHLQGNNLDDTLRANGIGQGNNLLKYYDVSADLGGRVLRDKLWFYGAVLKQSIDQSVLGTATTDPISVSNQTLKLTYQPAAGTRLIGFYAHNLKAEPQRAASRFRPLENAYDYSFPPLAWKGEVQSTLKQKVLINVLGGYVSYWAYYYPQPGTDVAGNPSRYDLTTTSYTGPNEMLFNRFKSHWQSSGNIVVYDLSMLGKHELKAGYNLDAERFGIEWPNRASGNYLLTFDKGAPLQMTTYNLPITALAAGRRNAAGLYVQDAWKLGTRLAINLGLRGQGDHYFDDAVTKPQGVFGNAGTFPKRDILTWNGLAPRFGAAYDVTGNGKTVVKTTFGIYNYNIGVDFTDQYNPSSLQQTVYRWRDLNSNRDYDTGEVNLSLTGPDFVSTTGAANILVNQDLKQGKTYEYSASVEREVAANFSMRALYVYKRLTNYEYAVNALRPYSAYNIPIARQDPGSDGVLGTADDGSTVTLYDYDPAYRGNSFVATEYVNKTNPDYYHTVEVAANKRYSQNLNVVASFSRTQVHRWIVGVAQSPNDLFFPLDTTTNWQAKVTANYTAPHGIQLAMFYAGLSGNPGQRTYVFRNLPQSSTLTVRMDAFGSEHLPTQNVVNFRLGKRFVVAKKRVDLALDLFNALNTNSATAQTYVSGPSFGAITSALGPRILRVGASLSF